MKTILCSLCLILGSSASWGSTWVQVGDAGSLPSTAQVTFGGGPLTEIDGKLGDGTGGADMYEIMITDPTEFSAVTVDINSNYIIDPSLFLFDSNGDALFAVDSSTDGTTQADIPQGTLDSLTAGLYYLLIAPQGNEPENKGAKALFSDAPVSGVVSPNSLKDLVIDRYSKGGDGNSGKYEIDLTGAGFAAAPEPATIMLIGAGLLAVGVQRKLKA